MQETEGVLYSNWLELVNEAKNEGLKSESLKKLANCHPNTEQKIKDERIYNELVKLENVLVQVTIERFQKKVNASLEENDVEFLQIGLRELKQNIKKCFFFMEVMEYPQLIRKDLCEKITDIVLVFWKEFMEFVNQMGRNSNDVFAEDFVYLCKNFKMNKFVEGYKSNG